MAAKQIGNLESNLFETSEEPKALAERLRGERTISWERAPIDHEYFGPASEILTEIDEENIRQPTEEKVYQIAFRLMGLDYIADPEKREQLFLDNPELHKEFSEKYWIAGQAVNFRMGGTSYITEPPEITLNYGKPSKRGALFYIGLTLGATLLGALAYNYFTNKDDNDNGDNGEPNGNTTNGNATNGNTTEPVDLDTDDDGYFDKVETEAGSDPYNPQSIPGNIDADPLPDTYEQDKFGDLRYDGSEDPDNDLKTIIEEYRLGTDPLEFEENVKNRLIRLGYSEEQTQHAFDQILDMVEDPDYSQEAAVEYDSRIAGLEEYEIRALTERTIEKDEHIARGDWDRDGNQNAADIHLFDPTNRHERLKEEGVEYVEKVIEYNDEQNPEELLPDLYEEHSLEKAMDFVETRPEIVADINKYGADALPIILSDKEMVEIAENPRYQLLMHAVVMQAQKYFYDVKNTMYLGKWDGPDNGIMLNERLDLEEKQILDQRWEDRDILLVDDEERMMNLRSRVLNIDWFFMDAESGLRRVEDWHHEDTDTWIRNGLRNIELCPQIREQLLEVLNDPEQKTPLVEEFLRFYSVTSFGSSGQRFREYSKAILNYGDEWDEKLMALNMIARAMAGHELYVSTASLYASFLGKNIYHSEGTLPLPLGGPDGKSSIVFSPQGIEAIKNIGEPLVDEETGALPTVYGVEKEFLNIDGVRYVVLLTENGPKTLYGQKD